MTDNNSKIRNIGIDYLKVFGIYLMVLGHSQYLPDNLESIIYSFHMPIFFFISGYLFKDDKFQNIIYKGARSLLLPYFLINMICLGLWIITECLHNSITLSTLCSRLGGVFLGLGYERFGFVPVCAPTWFFLALFWCRGMLNFYARKCNKIWSKTIALLSVTFAVSIMKKMGCIAPYAISSALLALPIMIFAYEYRRWSGKVDIKSRTIVIMLTSLIIASVSFLINNDMGRYDIDAVWYGNSLLLFYVDTIASCLFLFLLFGFFTFENKVVITYSTGTIAVVGFHLTIAYYVCKFKYFNLIDPTIAAFASSLLVIILCWPLIIMFGKYYPAIIGKRNKI